MRFPSAVDALQHLSKAQGIRPLLAWRYGRCEQIDFVVVRFIDANGEKAVRPFERDEEGRWSVSLSMKENRPLLYVDEVESSLETVYVFEGELCAQYARDILGLNATTSSGGAAVAKKTDWSPMNGRDVVLCPDADDPGIGYIDDVRSLVREHARSLRVVRLPDIVHGSGDDVVDWGLRRMLAGATKEDVRDEFLALAADAEDELAPKPLIKLRLLSDEIREDEHLSYLWRGRIARGDLCMLAGEEKVGKSLLVAHLISRITRGEPLHGDEDRREPGRAIVFSTEDQFRKWQNRCDASEADLERILFAEFGGELVDGGMFTFSVEEKVLLDTMRSVGPLDLVVFDPLEDYLAVSGVDAYKSTEVRRRLRPISAIAAKTGTAILLVHHTNKGAAPDSRRRIMGSSAYRSTCRWVLYLVADPDDESRRLLYVDKTGDDADPAPALAYTAPHAQGDPSHRVISWSEEPVTDTLEEVLAKSAGERAKPRGQTKTERAEAWLLDYLEDAGDWVASSRITAAFSRAGIAGQRTFAGVRAALVEDGSIIREEVGGMLGFRLANGALPD